MHLSLQMIKNYTWDNNNRGLNHSDNQSHFQFINDNIIEFVT